MPHSWWYEAEEPSRVDEPSTAIDSSRREMRKYEATKGSLRGRDCPPSGMDRRETGCRAVQDGEWDRVR